MALTPRLLKTTTLSLTRKKKDGSYNDSGDWVEGTDKATVSCKGSLQPYKQGESRVELPEGVTAKDVRIFYTKDRVLAANEYDNQESDRTVINSIPYKCFYVEDWATHGLKVNNFKVFWVREDKMNGG